MPPDAAKNPASRYPAAVRIVVCVKHVPDIQSDRAIGDDGRVVRDGGDGTLNELDENAVEAAVAIAEQWRAAGLEATVTAISVGPDDAEDAVRRALQMGAGAGVLVTDDAIAGSDVVGTARVLAATVAQLAADEAVDLVVTGMASMDGLTAMLPAVLAELLGWPALTMAREVEATPDGDGATLRVTRDVEGGSQQVGATGPLVLSVTDAANAPRYPTFPAIMAARKIAVQHWTLADLGIDADLVGETAARMRVVSAAPRPERSDRVLLTADPTAGEQLAAYLVARGLA